MFLTYLTAYSAAINRAMISKMFQKIFSWTITDETPGLDCKTRRVHCEEDISELPCVNSLIAPPPLPPQCYPLPQQHWFRNNGMLSPTFFTRTVPDLWNFKDNLKYKFIQPLAFYSLLNSWSTAKCISHQGGYIDQTRYVLNSCWS